MIVVARRIAVLLLLVACSGLGPSWAAERPNVAVVAFGLFNEGVFEREATGAAAIVASRFAADPVIVRFNGRRQSDATIPALAEALTSAASKLDREKDMLFVILTSHGTRKGLAVRAEKRMQLLTPKVLSEMLERTGVRRKVVVISACYSGVFVRRLASPDTLVITAADPDHPSFGCEPGAKWTYFGEAFFNDSLRQAANLREAFARAKEIVLRRERRNGFDPSNPQIAGGENLSEIIVAQGPPMPAPEVPAEKEPAPQERPRVPATTEKQPGGSAKGSGR